MFWPFKGPLLLMAGLGVAAVSIPIIIHFFFRSRYRTVPWAAMEFLLTSIEQTSRRIKFQELLLLLLRCLLVALLAFALTRFITGSFGGSAQGLPVDAVFLFDLSFSMNAREGEKSRLDLAKAAALEVLRKLPPSSSVQIVTFSDRAKLIGPRVPTNFEKAEYLIENLRTSHMKTDVLPGLRESLRVLKRRALPNKELYIFSDMQKSGWETQSAAITETMRDIDREAPIFLIQCGKRQLKNVAVIEVTPQTGIPRPGEPVNFAVMVKNTGSQDLNNLQISLTLDGAEKTRETTLLRKLSAGQTVAKTLSLRMTKEGLHVVSAHVKHDDLPADNRLDQVINVTKSLRILVIDGAYNKTEDRKSASYYIWHALQPVLQTQLRKYHYQPFLITPGRAIPGMLNDYDLCILTDVALKPDISGKVEHLSPEFLDDLNRFVREGQGLIVFPGNNVTLKEYNAELFKERKLLPFELGGWIEKTPKSPKLLFVNRKSAHLSYYPKLREDLNYYKDLSIARVFKTLDLKEAAIAPADKNGKKAPKANIKKQRQQSSAGAATVALRYNNGKPLIVFHRVDSGQVILFTTSAHPGEGSESTDPMWSDLPIVPSWVPVMDMTINHLHPRKNNIRAGATRMWFAPRKMADRSFILFRPDGKKQYLGRPTMRADRPVVEMHDLTGAGVYWLMALKPGQDKSELLNDPHLAEQIRSGRAGAGWPFAVRPDLSESINLDTLGKEQLLQQLRAQENGLRVIHATAGMDPDNYSGLQRSIVEWTGWLLLAVLFLMLAEGLLAWFCGRPL